MGRVSHPQAFCRSFKRQCEAKSALNPLTLLLALLVFIPLQRQLHRHLQGLLALLLGNTDIALIVYAVLLLPGVALHEASHWLAAKTLGVPTGRFSLLPKRTEDKGIRFGYVETGRVDPLRSSLIGAAPLITGMLALGLIGLDLLGLHPLPELLIRGDFVALTSALEQVLSTPDLLLWIYLIFTVSNTMLPSIADRSSWLAVLILFAAIAAVALALGVPEQITGWLASQAGELVPHLTGIFIVAIAVDSLLLLPIVAVEKILGRVFGWEIVYS